MEKKYSRFLKKNSHCFASLKFVAACLYSSHASSDLSPLFPINFSKNDPNKNENNYMDDLNIKTFHFFIA